MLFVSREKRLVANSKLVYYPNVEIKFNALKKDKLLSFEAETPLREFERVHFSGTITQDENHGNVINGVLKSDKASYNVEGHYKTSYDIPLSVSFSK